MNKEHYPLQKANGREAYFFESDGSKGIVLKIVEFSWLRGNIWNLGFGDILPDGDWDDHIVSNNGDLPKIMATVVFAAQLFIQNWPDRAIEITPVDQRRSRLYHRIFRLHELDLKQFLTIEGVVNDQIVDFRPDLVFDAFLLTPKPIPL